MIAGLEVVSMRAEDRDVLDTVHWANVPQYTWRREFPLIINQTEYSVISWAMLRGGSQEMWAPSLNFLILMPDTRRWRELLDWAAVSSKEAALFCGIDGFGCTSAGRRQLPLPFWIGVVATVGLVLEEQLEAGFKNKNKNEEWE